MAPNLITRWKRAWNAFQNRDPTYEFRTGVGSSYAMQPYRHVLNPGTERSIISAIYNRIAVDVSEVTIQHVRLDDNGRYVDTIDSGLNRCLNVEANIDQTGKAFIEDLVLSMMDEGVVAAVPVDTADRPENEDAYDPDDPAPVDIRTMRTGRITQWYPGDVRVELYNDRTGNREELVLPKRMVAIIENPFYSVMNEPNSTLTRLKRKLNLLDVVDEQNSSGKLDLIIQLPYVVKSETRKKQAEKRRAEIEEQLRSSQYGIAYTDGTERITQLNRAVENNILPQIEYLTSMLYSQLGLTKEVFEGTADSEVLNNYYSRTIEPIVSAITKEFYRKFLSKQAQSRNQSIYYFKDPFRMIPVNQISEIADKFTRNEILTSNEVRQIIGMKASDDPRADELRNKNLSESDADQFQEEIDEVQKLKRTNQREQSQNGG